jgi:hypothetical protein
MSHQSPGEVNVMTRVVSFRIIDLDRVLTACLVQSAR